MSGHLCFASLAKLPDRSTKCGPASAGATNRAVGPASNPFPSGLLPSGIGMAKPTLQQARDRAEWLAISVRATPLTFTARRSAPVHAFGARGPIRLHLLAGLSFRQ